MSVGIRLARRRWRGKEESSLPQKTWQVVRHDSLTDAHISLFPLQATWLKFLLLDGRSPITNEQVIPSHILAAATTPYVTLHEPEPLYLPHIGAKTYGLGQILYNYRGYEIVEHFGSVPGQRSRILRVPEKRLGLAIMVNDEVAWTYTEVVQYMILDRLLGLDPIDWKARCAVRRTIMDMR